jgi:hypothetical protein
MKKKGEVTLAFSWIYVAVVGALILIGATYFIINMRNEAKESFYADAKKYVYNFMKQVSQTPNVEKKLNMEGADLELTCDNFFITQSDMTAITYQYDFLFSPNLIKRILLGYSDFLELPMKTVRLTYLTSPEIKYLFLESDETKKLETFFPEHISKDIIQSYSGFSSKEHYKIRYITFGDVPSVGNLGTLANFKDNELTIVKIDVIEDRDRFPDSFGKASYYSKKKGSFEKTGEVFFVDRASLIAAIYSENSEFYYCNFEKVYPRLKVLFDIEKDRISSISQFNNAKQCTYESTLAVIEQMISQLSQKPNPITLQEIYSLKKKLREENRYLERLSCPVIY